MERQASERERPGDATAAAGQAAAPAAAAPPLLPEHGRLRTRAIATALDLALHATLLVSPRPGALLVRRVFAAGGARTARALARHAPDGVDLLRDERYGPGRGMLLDLYRPVGAEDPLPLVVWFHGGGWVGGSKEELAGWMATIAARGHAVAAPRYGLAPGTRYPAALSEAMAALAHLRRDAGRLGLDADRIVLAGDSAGAQLAAQLAALATTPGYAEQVGVPSTIEPERLRGVVLACGPYDLDLLGAGRARAATTADRLVRAVLWAWSGRRRYAADRRFATASVVRHLSPAFPPALITVGNADPLRAHSELLAARLAEAGAEVETLFFGPDHRPPLGHEYQFDLDGDAGRRFLARMLDFLARRLAP